MRIATAFLIAAILTMVIGAVTVLANEKESPDSPSRLGPAEQTQLDAVLEKVNEIESVEEPGNDIEIQEILPPAVYTTLETTVTLDTVWEKSPDVMSLSDRLIKAVLRSRTLPGVKGSKPQFYWERCGVPVPEDQMITQAAEWVTIYLSALDEVKRQTEVQLPVWGAFATMANEGGFNECGLNFEARKWASEHESKILITETWHGRTVKRKVLKKVVDKFRQSYDRDTVWNIVTNPDYKTAKVQVKGKDGQLKWKNLGNKFDGGAWQMRYSMKTISRERFNALTSLYPGVYLGAREMARRALSYMPRFHAKEPHPRPWMLWPGWDPFTPAAWTYDTKITMVARYLGARRDEIERGALPVSRMDNSKRESHLLGTPQ
jgi:hypothetical protein